MIKFSVVTDDDSAFRVLELRLVIRITIINVDV